MISVIMGAVHRSLGICLTAKENPRKPQLGDRLKKGLLRPVIASNGVHFLQMRSVASHSTSGREKEGIKESPKALDSCYKKNQEGNVGKF